MSIKNKCAGELRAVCYEKSIWARGAARGQIYLGYEMFIAAHQPDRGLREIAEHLGDMR